MSERGADEGEGGHALHPASGARLRHVKRARPLTENPSEILYFLSGITKANLKLLDVS